MSRAAELGRLTGYPFEVRYSEGARTRAVVAAELAGDAYAYFSTLFSAVKPDIALIVADESDWSSRQPYGLAFFNDDAGQSRPGVVMLEALGDLRLPTSWLSEIFVNLAMHAVVATRMRARLPTLETLPIVGAGSQALAARMRAEGYSTLDESEARDTGGENPMSPLNYVWFQYRWQRLAAEMFNVDGTEGLTRFWDCFHAKDHGLAGATAASLAPLLTSRVSTTLGRAVEKWDSLVL